MGKGAFILLAILWATTLTAKNYSVKHVEAPNEISNNWVRCIHQDQMGFMWVGTSDGLNRYDGVTYKTYRPTWEDNTIIGNVTVNAIAQKDSATLWIGTDMGLYNFSLVDESFVFDSILPPHPVMEIVMDNDGEFWFGTNGGLFRLTTNKHNPTLYQNNPDYKNCIADNYINTITIAKDNKLWIGTKGGLSIYDKTHHQFTNYTNNDELGSLSGNDVLEIVESDHQTFWIATANNGLNLASLTNKKITFKTVLEGSILDLLIDKKNHLWIAHSSEEGMLVVDLNPLETDNPSSIFSQRSTSQKILTTTATFTLYEDNEGDIWIGTYGNGLNFFSYKTQPFYTINEQSAPNIKLPNSHINTFYEEEAYLWIGTEGGLIRKDKSNNTYRLFNYEKEDPYSLRSNPVLAIYKDSFKNLWVGTWAGGLHRYNYSNETFSCYYPSEEEGSLSSENVFSILQDSRNNLWIGTNRGGLNRFDYETEKFTTYLHQSDNASSLAGRSINYLLETSDSALLISMYSAVDRFNYHTNSFDHITRQANKQVPGNISTLFEDSHKHIWMATNAGLELYSNDLKYIRSYTIADGLPSNTIMAILEDDHQNLWLSTNSGLSRFQNGALVPDSVVFHNFSNTDELVVNDFKSRSAYKNRQGIMYFGSTNGFVYFHPDSIQLNQSKPKIVFTDFFIQYSSPNANSVYKNINTNLNIHKQVDLHHPNTDFIINFASLNYVDSEKNSYRFKLEGYDTEWIDAGNSTSATYTNLKQGNYVFKVKGSNNDGLWCNEPNYINITIHPPWWNSRHSKIIIFLLTLISGSVFIAIRFISLSKTNRELEARVEKRTEELLRANDLLEEKQNKIVEQNNELEEHKSHLEKMVKKRTIELEAAKAMAEESDYLKSAFLANMSHEIRTPMNAIIGFSTMLAEKELPAEKRTKYLQHIRSNGKSLNVLINDIIDISIIEAKQLILSKSNFKIDAVLSSVYQQFELENNNQFTFSYNRPRNLPEVEIYNDPVRFKQVIVNLVSNAFKYSDNGKIEFGYDVFDHTIQFYVKDEGIGIRTSETNKVFDLFYKADKDKTKLFRGTGIGLAICKNLIKQMGGKIWVKSEYQRGSTFYFTLPIVRK